MFRSISKLLLFLLSYKKCEGSFSHVHCEKLVGIQEEKNHKGHLHSSILDPWCFDLKPVDIVPLAIC